ncbi:LacI family transcriptional regulator [Kribbella sp. VKM Ac-2571]|uniref:LacI family DNA-binding transcriptional regulator n=1 Tax=Kribbella sp. VKM Ac-2571 TaxID=2512222 RepID=UPI00105C1526|nr:LacI family DNA-binding transcriptional regulator [Kribbella sp. VKM Ac-2571]TDO68730.1 LacI family transcriptional regulator [Kribbella sp. VKM Ac-2571]
MESEPARRPRLEDVAATTGVSIKTVSRALRGDPKVRESTRQRIVAEADRLGVQLNDVAAGLRRKNQAMTSIGVTLGDCTNPFFAPMLRGIHSVASERGYLVLTADAQNDPELEHRAIRSFFAHRVAGLIIAPVGNDLGYLANEARFGSAIVFVDSPPPGLGESMDSVTTTNAASTRSGIEHLLAKGRRRIAYLGHPRSGSGAEERWAGYVAALEAAGIAVDPGLVRDNLVSEDDARRAAEDLLPTAAPDAVFVDNNRLCTGLLQSKAFANRRIDTVCFDRFELAAAFGVSVIDSDPYDVGRAGAQLLFDRLTDPTRAPQRLEVPARLVVNDTPTY